MNDFSKQDTKLYRGSVFRKGKGLLTKQVKERKKEARQKRDVQLKKIKSQTNWKGNRADKIKEVDNKYYDTLDKIELDKEQYENLLDEYGPLAPADKTFMTPKKIKKKDPYAEGTRGKGSPPGVESFKKKKGGGKITYRMTGGQVVASSYDK